MFVVFERSHDISKTRAGSNNAVFWILLRVGAHHLGLDKESIVVHVVVDKFESVGTVSCGGLDDKIHFTIFIEIHRNQHDGVGAGERSDQAETGIGLEVLLSLEISLVSYGFIITHICFVNYTGAI